MKKPWLCKSRVLMIIALILGAVGMIAYMKSGITQFNTTLSQEALIGFGVGIGLSLISLVLNWKAVRFCAYLALLYAMLKSISFQANYIANVLVSIDGNSFSFGFLLTAGATLLAAVFALIAACSGSGKEAAA